MEVLDTIHVEYFSDGSIEVFSDKDPEGIRVEFSSDIPDSEIAKFVGGVKDWSLAQKYLVAYKDFLRKKFGPQEELA